LAHADTGAGFDIDVRLFLFIITAARRGDDSRPGRRTVLVFSRGLQVGDAVDSAIDQVDALGWSDVELQAAKEVTDDIATERDALARDAMERALADGFAHLVY
jgi:hypothetical protein